MEDLNSFKDELPKGMATPEVVAPKISIPFNLGCSNYVQAVYHALETLLITVQVEKCLVLEKHGEPPEVRLTLRILGAKEGAECRGAEISD